MFSSVLWFLHQLTNFESFIVNKFIDTMTTPTATARISSKKQTLEDAYSPPANFLEIDVSDPQTHGVAKKRYTDYEVRMKVHM